MSNEIIKIDKQAFLTTYTPKNIQTQLARVKSVSEAIKSDKNGVSYYRKNVGQIEIETIIGYLINNFQKSINVNKELNEFQIDELVNEILSSYYFLSITEIAFIFKRAKLGYYKVNTFAISMPDVMQWFAQYTEERIKEYQKIQEQEHKTVKSGKEVIDGKLHEKQSSLTEKKLLNVFKEVKKELKPKFNKEEYDQIKGDINENGIEKQLIDRGEDEKTKEFKKKYNLD
jgi:hypothetical protein